MRVTMGVAVARRVIVTVVLVSRHVWNLSTPRAVHYFKLCMASRGPCTHCSPSPGA